jgi:hypothetical protein
LVVLVLKSELVLRVVGKYKEALKIPFLNIFNSLPNFLKA